MPRRLPLIGRLALLLAVLAGCTPQQPFYFHQNLNNELSHYIGMATEIEVPDVKECPLGEVEGALRPLSLANSDAKEIWDLKLEDAVKFTLENSKVIRQLGGAVAGAPTALTQQPDAAVTIYDPAVVESDARGGVEAALAAFDAQLSSSLYWERNHTPQNVSPVYGGLQPQDFLNEPAQFQTQIQKTSATGAAYTVTNTIAYDFQNAERAFPSDWTTNFQIQVRQPLLQGAGVEFNRIAGPNGQPGVYNGVMLARINTDIALAAFEGSVRNLVLDVETAYWELYYSYRNLDAVVAGRNAALETWRKIHALYVVSAKGGEADKEFQAREQYYLFRSSVETSLASLYAAESKLRYLMGLAATDGRLIRPADEPTTAKVTFDWADTHAEALCRSVELRQQRWKVKQRELQLVAAKNYLLPRLDAVASYTWNGMDQEQLGTADTPFSAYQDMLHGDYQSWHLGLQATVPLGFRKEMAGVRNAEHLLAREKAKLQEEELEVSHQVAYAMRDMESNLLIAQTDFNRCLAAQKEVDAVRAAYEAGQIILDVLLEAQRNLADAQSGYYRVLVNYNVAIAQVHYRKGSLLEYNGVYLAEGPWPGKAYFDARRRARARDAAHYINYGFTLPPPISRGPINQRADSRPLEGVLDGPGQAIPETNQEPKPEAVPTPAPITATPPAPTTAAAPRR